MNEAQTQKVTFSSFLKLLRIAVGHMVFSLLSAFLSLIFAVYPRFANTDCGAWGQCWDSGSFRFFTVIYIILQMVFYLVFVKLFKVNATAFWIVSVSLLVVSLWLAHLFGFTFWLNKLWSDF